MKTAIYKTVEYSKIQKKIPHPPVTIKLYKRGRLSQSQGLIQDNSSKVSEQGMARKKF